jgi:hypothetical protein
MWCQGLFQGVTGFSPLLININKLISLRKIFSAFCVGLCFSPPVAALLTNVHSMFSTSSSFVEYIYFLNEVRQHQI